MKLSTTRSDLTRGLPRPSDCIAAVALLLGKTLSLLELARSRRGICTAIVRAAGRSGINRRVTKTIG